MTLARRTSVTDHDGAMRLQWSASGNGPPIVLVHGWGLSAERNWVDTGWVAALEPVRRVVLLDVRGHGRSSKPRDPAAYRYGAMSADVLQVMDEAGIERADLFGYSMGAFMGAALLGSHPERFRSMVLGGIGDETLVSAAVAADIAAALREPDPAAIASPVARGYRSFVDADPTSDLEALAVSALAMWPDGHPLEVGGPGLSDADVPVLIVNGSDDHPYVDTAPRFAAELARAELLTIPGCDHLTALVHPAFRAAVLGFLDGVAAD